MTGAWALVPPCITLWPLRGACCPWGMHTQLRATPSLMVGALMSLGLPVASLLSFGVWGKRPSLLMVHAAVLPSAVQLSDCF